MGLLAFAGFSALARRRAKINCSNGRAQRTKIKGGLVKLRPIAKSVTLTHRQRAYQPRRGIAFVVAYMDRVADLDTVQIEDRSPIELAINIDVWLTRVPYEQDGRDQSQYGEFPLIPSYHTGIF